MTSGQKVAITGGSGYLGFALATELAKTNDVFILDLVPPRQLLQNMTYISCDVTDQQQVNHSLQKMQVVVHRAGLMNNGASMKKPSLYYKVNVQGTLNALQGCVQNNVERFLLDSTEAVYGPAVSSPVTEDQTPIPGSIYGATKLIAEDATRFFERKYSLSTVIFRHSRIRHFSKDDAILKLSKQVLGQNSITLYDGGRPIIDFVELSDVVAANLSALDSGVRNETINISSGEGISFSGIVETIESITGKRARDVKFEYPSRTPPSSEFHFGPETFYMSVQKARRLLNWQPKFTTRESIRNTIEYLRTSQQ